MKIGWDGHWRRGWRGGGVSGVRGRGLIESFYVGFDLGSLNLPRVRAEWWDEDIFGVAVEWGNGNSDPVWTVSVSVRPSWWIRRRHMLSMSRPAPPPDLSASGDRLVLSETFTIP